ncbi:Glycosyl transferase family 11 [Roseovarius azorensis]|uniref:Glycosyl transferase family 11 n=1 Tax=Roseovarius azorensis TaxID=1287727 RepID=A0A1H7RDX6_9RHOB|nr:alpha-1,2-fucosyltransferase [Roseovarius azorensis]SEL58441.1 Glycosyl transferase family 11 [Roseovarius azorensis]
MTQARIISRLFGGAGNQLFQYAAGRALADHLGVALQLDTRYVGGGRANCFGHFKCTRFTEEPPLPPAKSDGLLRYGLWRLFGRNPRFRRERFLGFDPAFFDLPRNTYLHGYWQSEHYFAPILERLRRDLTFTTPLDPANANMAARIADAACPVSVHVRRGDYLASGSYVACPPEYYQQAIATLAYDLGQPLTCFIFSNDPDWARDNLALGQEQVVVDINDEARGPFDLHLMSRCAHHVIANSTFSWWGAWLNPGPDKRVIAPKNWFGTPRLSNPDLIPEGWNRL